MNDLDLVGITGITEILGISRQRAYELARRSEFPEPATRIRTRRYWQRADIVEWAHEQGREVRE